MKKLKLFAAALMSAAMLFAAPVFADETPAETTSPFTDVDVNTETGKAILKLYNAGVIAGYEDNTFKPDGNITRAELVRIFNQVFKYAPSEESLANVKNFDDNADPAAWYYNDVRIAQISGYINGFEDNTFRGKENFTRQQACVVIDLITGVNTYDNTLVINDEVSEWADRYVNWALTAGLFPLEENNTFRATQNITRGEVCSLLEIFVTEDNGDTEVKENETQEVTVKTSNGTVVKVTKGSSSSGSSSSSKDTTKAATTVTVTTEKTTEATTKETTTKATTTKKETTTKTTTTKKETTTKTTTTEKKTETTTREIESVSASDVEEPSEDILSALDSVYQSLDAYVIPSASSGSVASVATQIRDAIGNYLADHTFDITTAANDAIDNYKYLSGTERKELKNLIIEYCNISDLLTLQETFFPGLLYEM